MLLLLASAGGASAQDKLPGGVFPQPFVVEHSVVMVGPDGDVFATDPVTDSYGGSWIVSERIDGSRRVIDFARREITEISAEKASYSVLTFDRFAELQRRIAAAEQLAYGGATEAADGSEDPELEIKIEDSPLTKAGSSVVLDEQTEKLLNRPGVRRITVRAENPQKSTAPAAEMDVWFDPQLRLSARGVHALERFEQQVLAVNVKPGTPAASMLLAAARQHTGGAVPLRTSRSAVLGVSAEEAGTIDDIAVSVQRLGVWPDDLVTVPEGYQRVAHPLELMASWAEQEAELNQKMSARPAR